MRGVRTRQWGRSGVSAVRRCVLRAPSCWSSRRRPCVVLAVALHADVCLPARCPLLVPPTSTPVPRPDLSPVGTPLQPSPQPSPHTRLTKWLKSTTATPSTSGTSPSRNPSPLPPTPPTPPSVVAVLLLLGVPAVAVTSDRTLIGDPSCFSLIGENPPPSGGPAPILAACGSAISGASVQPGPSSNPISSNATDDAVRFDAAVAVERAEAAEAVETLRACERAGVRGDACGDREAERREEVEAPEAVRRCDLDGREGREGDVEANAAEVGGWGDGSSARSLSSTEASPSPDGCRGWVRASGPCCRGWVAASVGCPWSRRASTACASASCALIAFISSSSPSSSGSGFSISWITSALASSGEYSDPESERSPVFVSGEEAVAVRGRPGRTAVGLEVAASGAASVILRRYRMKKDDRRRTRSGEQGRCERRCGWVGARLDVIISGTGAIDGRGAPAIHTKSRLPTDLGFHDGKRAGLSMLHACSVQYTPHTSLCGHSLTATAVPQSHAARCASAVAADSRRSSSGSPRATSRTRRG